MADDHDNILPGQKPQLQNESQKNSSIENPIVTEAEVESEIEHEMDPVEAGDAKTDALIAPWHVYNALGSVGRIVMCAGLVIALVAATLYVVNVDIGIFEAISTYATVLFLFWLAVIDTKYFRLPNSVLLAWMACRMMLMTATAVQGGTGILISSGIGAGLMLFLFLIAYYLSGRSLGGGDVKLSFVLGLSLTFSMVFTPFFLVLCSAPLLV